MNGADPPPSTSLLSPDEQMDGNVPFSVLLDVLTIGASLRRPILALPLELCRG